VKRDNINYVLVGGVVLAAVAALLVALSLITGRSGASSDYHSYYRNVTGLRYGAPIFYQGFRIGQVTGVVPERDAKGTRYRVELSVRRDWQIPRDSLARLTASGLLADVSIGIQEGPSKDFAAPGSELPGMESSDIFSAMNELASQLNELTRAQLTPLITTLTTRVDSITGSIDKNTPEILEQARALLKRLNNAGDSLNDVLKPENRAAIAGILNDVRGVTKELHKTRETLDSALVQLDAIAKENRPGVAAALVDLQTILSALASRIDSISHHLDVSTRNLDEFSREIRKNPNRLLIAPSADKVEEEDK
jgi:phospholipid/cholesterol/gamma-HCH transport system substrate-binding protein